MPTPTPHKARPVLLTRAIGAGRRLRGPLVGVALVVAAVVLTTAVNTSGRTAELAQQDKAVVIEQARDATAPVADLCDDPSAVGDALRDDPDRPCELADQVQALLAAGPTGPVGATGARGLTGDGPSDEQVAAAVRAYLVANPPPAGRAPTIGEITGAVADFLSRNPPAPGRPPTGGEIAAAVDGYFNANPPPAGPAGDDGEPGRAPTPEEIAAAVADYLIDNPPPAGADGADGAAGPMCPPGETAQVVTYGIGGPSGTACVLS